MEEDSRETTLTNVIRIDDERVREHLGRIVRRTVERRRSGGSIDCAMRDVCRQRYLDNG